MGLLAAFISAFFNPLKDLVSKKLVSHVSGTYSAFASFLFALPYYFLLVLILFFLGLEPIQIGAGFFSYVVLRSITDSAAEWCKMHALSHGDFSSVFSLLSLAPVFLLVSSPLITGDQISFLGVIAVIMATIGSYLMVTPTHGFDIKRVTSKGIVFALGASFFFSLNTCFDRLAVQTASPAISGLAMTFLSCCILLPVIARERVLTKPIEAHVAKGLWLRGFLEISFMLSKLYALQTLQAPYVAGISRLALIFSVIMGRVYFKEEGFGRRMIASAFITVGVVLIVLEA